MAKLNDLLPAVSGTLPPQVDPKAVRSNQAIVHTITNSIECYKHMKYQMLYHMQGCVYKCYIVSLLFGCPSRALTILLRIDTAQNHSRSWKNDKKLKYLKDIVNVIVYHLTFTRLFFKNIGHSITDR